MAHEAQLLITVGSGGVQSVGMFKAKLRKVIKGTDYPFVWVKKHLPYDSKEVGWYRTPVEPSSNPGQKCLGQGALLEQMLNERKR